MDAYVYLHSENESIHAFAGMPSWAGSKFILLGTMPFHPSKRELTDEEIRDWALMRIGLLSLPTPRRLSPTVLNRTTRPYWPEPL